MFVIIFALFTADVWLNSPLDVVPKNAGLLVAILAAAAENVFGYGYVVSGLVWIGLFLFTKEKEKIVEEEKKKEEEQEKAGLPTLHPEGVKKVEESRKLFLENLNGGTTSDGIPWVLQAEDKATKSKFFWADFPGHSIKKWKCEVLIENANVQHLLEEVFNFEKRCGPNGWDVAIKDGKVLRKYEGGIYSLSLASTHPAGGGVISSREFLDLRGLYLEGDNVPKDGLVLAMCSVDPKKDKKWFTNMPKGNSKLVRGYAFPGSGVRVTPVDGTNNLLFETVSIIELNGWIPTSVINQATSSAMIDSNKMMQAHLRKVIGK
eukprot:CAMPEP_0204833692 /NCGR_PEP_ID=MMETSP1346-20131115/17500_1 /ASSEMBLY_ACC=CAM_ASM_000771 /TAXON_ID=215587 /ORGANISM="Aplanochytrium stocchinoi, Strain GSBS06" /LENGTH=318 /DNA_ID=CAMNT_0051966399 /DNA_START=22 /DNA_END=979 /DNA_ORIENTATION=-